MGCQEVLPFANMPAKFIFLSSYLPTLKNSTCRVRRPILPGHQRWDRRKASGSFRTLFPHLYIGIVILQDQVNASAL